MDALGHINNATFLTLIEQARIEALSAWFDGSPIVGSGFLVAGQEIDYLAQLRYRPTPVEIAVWCSKIGASSFEVASEVRDPASAGRERYAVSATAVVRFDPEAGHPRRLVEAERAVLERYSGESAPLRRRVRSER